MLFRYCILSFYTSTLPFFRYNSYYRFRYLFCLIHSVVFSERDTNRSLCIQLIGIDSMKNMRNLCVLAITSRSR